MSSLKKLVDRPFGTTWRKALVSLPRMVPDFSLYYLSPEGPQPLVFKIPSRGRHRIPIYVFVPQQNPRHPGPAKFPVLIDFHGGSFILGTPQEQAVFCAKMARELNCVVISVDYRLGPYDQYPAANHDAEDVVNAVISPSSPGYHDLRTLIQENLIKAERARPEPIVLDETRIAISGFSSGGNLALNLALSVKNDPTLNGADWPSPIPMSHPRPVPLLLFYPSLDCRMLPDERPRPAGLDAPKGFFTRLRLETELMPTYLPVAQRAHPRASPGLASLANSTTDANEGLHPQARILLVLPELDSLSEQSGIWVDRVQAEGRGGDLVVERVQGVPHGWTQFPDAWISEDHREKKRRIFDRAKEFVRVAWGGHHRKGVDGGASVVSFGTGREGDDRGSTTSLADLQKGKRPDRGSTKSLVELQKGRDLDGRSSSRSLRSLVDLQKDGGKDDVEVEGKSAEEPRSEKSTDKVMNKLELE